MYRVLIDLGVVRSISQYATIESLPNEVLREIFIFDRLISISLPQSHQLPRQPWKWQRLAQVCRRWRLIIFDSPRSLDLQLFCTYGTPVKSNLDSWPPLPIVMQYPSWVLLDEFRHSIPHSEISYEDNVMAALQNSDRICEIQLYVTTPLLEKLTTLPQKPFPVLEHLELEADTGNELILLNEPFVGPFPKLRVLYVARIAFPALQRVLQSARDLVELRLEALASMTPAALLTSLPITTRLESLYLHFHSPISRPISGGDRSAPQARAVLLSLKWFTFCGASEDLECLLSGIDAPGIMYINVTFFNQATIFGASQFLQFVSRTQSQKSHDTAMLCCSESEISMTLTQPGRPLQMMVRVLCMPLDWQLFCMAEIFAELYPIVRDVRNFHIDAIPSGLVQDDVDPSPLLELFRPFTNVEELFLPHHVVPHVMYSLEREGLLPNARITPCTSQAWPPRERTLPLHLAPWLAPNPISADRPHVVWDVSEPPSMARGISDKDVIVDINEALSSNVPAVFPETDEIVIVFHTGLAQGVIQPIRIKAHKVSCGEVFWAIYEYFQKPMSHDEVDIIKSRSEDDYNRLLEACYRRCSRAPGLEDTIRRQGVKRLDCLDDRTAWWGMRLVWAADSTWSLHLDLMSSSRA
jgi:F-box-like